MANPTIMFAMPSYGPIHRWVYESHMACMGSLAKDGIVCTPQSVIVTNKMGLAGAENRIVEAALRLKPDYVFWTEMDMILPTGAINALLKHDKDICSGLYFLRGSAQPCLFTKILENKENDYGMAPVSHFPDKLFTVTCPGMGCVLMKTSVLENLQYPYFNDSQGQCGTDIYFYTHAKKAGYKVWVDPAVICGQIDDDEPKYFGFPEYQEWASKKENLRGFIRLDKTHGIMHND